MKILFVDPHESSLFSFRKELLDAIINEGHEVVLCSEPSSKIQSEYGKKVSRFYPVSMKLKSKGLIYNLKLKQQYKRIIKSEKPGLIISYKIKPNIYCGFYAKNIPMIANITGLGNIFKKKGLLSCVGLCLYRKSFKNVDHIFFQNKDSYDFFVEHKIPMHGYSIIPGSGVNLEKFYPQKDGKDNLGNTVNFLFASRAIKEKGFELLLEAIPEVVMKTKDVHFNFLNAEEDVKSNPLFKEVIGNYSSYISLLSRTDDMRSIYLNNSFLVSPSYYREGISNVLIESLACGRPIITTMDNPGCMETLQDGVNGFGIKSNDLDSLIAALVKAASLDKNQILEMGKAGREFVEKQFDRQIVIDNYLSVINKF